MCGIAGQVGRDPRTIQTRYGTYCAMQQTMARRGPDQRGMYISGRAALIHARLAVVDLENGLQPMQLDWQDESYVLVYNGELYNTPELAPPCKAAVTALWAILIQRSCCTPLRNGAQGCGYVQRHFLPLPSGRCRRVRCFWRGTAAGSNHCFMRRRSKA